MRWFLPPPKITGCYQKNFPVSVVSLVHCSLIISYAIATFYHSNLCLLLVVNGKKMEIIARENQGEVFSE